MPCYSWAMWVYCSVPSGTSFLVWKSRIREILCASHYFLGLPPASSVGGEAHLPLVGWFSLKVQMQWTQESYSSKYGLIFWCKRMQVNDCVIGPEPLRFQAISLTHTCYSRAWSLYDVRMFKTSRWRLWIMWLEKMQIVGHRLCSWQWAVSSPK